MVGLVLRILRLRMTSAAEGRSRGAKRDTDVVEHDSFGRCGGEDSLRYRTRTELV